jgi:hypothetical protein
MGCCSSIPIMSDSLVLRKNSCRNIYSYYDTATQQDIEAYCNTKWLDEVTSITQRCPHYRCYNIRHGSVAQCYYGNPRKLLTLEKIIERLTPDELSKITHVSYDRSLSTCSRRLILHSNILDHHFVYPKNLAIGIYPHVKDVNCDVVWKAWQLINTRLGRGQVIESTSH